MSDAWEYVSYYLWFMDQELWPTWLLVLYTLAMVFVVIVSGAGLVRKR